MQNIGGFFEKFRSKVVQEVQNLVFVIEIIKKHTKINLDMKDLKLSNGILRIKASPLQKSEIFMKKTQILKEINQKVKVDDIQ